MGTRWVLLSGQTTRPGLRIAPAAEMRQPACVSAAYKSRFHCRGIVLQNKRSFIDGLDRVSELGVTITFRREFSTCTAQVN
jgi:hypothetical protein